MEINLNNSILEMQEKLDKHIERAYQNYLALGYTKDMLVISYNNSPSISTMHPDKCEYDVYLSVSLDVKKEYRTCENCKNKGRMWYNQKNGMCIGCVNHDRWEAGKNE